MMYQYYQLFGQSIKSDIELPEAIKINQTNAIDIVISCGEPPRWVLDAMERGQEDYISKEIMWFYLEKTILFYVENGNHITIHKVDQEISEATVRAYLTGTAMCLALVQKGYLPVHGSTTAINDQGVIISGRSGSGKSTVSIALYQMGFMFLSDDLSAVYEEDDIVRVLPGFPQQKICRDVINELNLEESELVYIDENRDKFGRILKKGYLNDRLPVSCMIELITSETDEEVSWKMIEGIRKLEQLSCNIYRGEIYQRLEKTPEMMKLFLEVAQKVPMFQVTHPRKHETLKDVISCIIEEIIPVTSKLNMQRLQSC